MEEIDMEDMRGLLEWYPYKSVIQRMGFLMDKLQAENDLIPLLYDHLIKKNIHSVLLNPVKGAKPGKTGNRWRVDVNISLEGDI